MIVFSSPARHIFSFTSWPAFFFAIILASELSLFTLSPSILVIISPCSTPAFSAGDPSTTDLIILDPERSNFVKQMFDKIANQGHSGRMIKMWLDRIGFETKNGKRLALSKVYATLKNPFYYGEFEFPLGSETWYKGKHKPLITKELFDKTQLHLQIQPDKGYKNKLFPFKKIFKCGKCGGGITAEEKYSWNLIRKIKLLRGVSRKKSRIFCQSLKSEKPKSKL